VFNPPPKVKSRVTLEPKEDYSLPCKGKLFFTVVNRFSTAPQNLQFKTLNLTDNFARR
jgi:16S rRNA A1518/A1519 N6-dimethyltransferase RsmA/KsgA/DIM1 with predicted DNA glycosylase/AP lyase activity